jgi:hypothetical protein
MFGNSKRIAELELKVWALQNPCKFKIGQKLKGGRLVIDIELRHEQESFLFPARTYWNINYLKGDEKITLNQKSLIEVLSKYKK